MRWLQIVTAFSLAYRPHRRVLLRWKLSIGFFGWSFDNRSGSFDGLVNSQLVCLDLYYVFNSFLGVVKRPHRELYDFMSCKFSIVSTSCSYFNFGNLFLPQVLQKLFPSSILFLPHSFLIFILGSNASLAMR